MGTIKDLVTPSTDYVTATIASGESLSAAVNLGGLQLAGVVMPDTWTTAQLTFQMSVDGGTTWHNIGDGNGAGSRYSIATPTAGQYEPVSLSIFAPITHLRLRSGTAATPVAQAAARTLTLVVRSV